MRLKRKDWLILLGFYILTISPLIIGLFEIGKKNYDLFVFFAGFLPIFSIHSTTLGLRFRNIYFSSFWIIMIILNALLFNNVIPIWISMSFSFAYYHLLRILFRKINGQDPIPILVAPGSKLKYNDTELRMENQNDLVFTVTSFMSGLLISGLILALTK
jgi:hypothetical protein